jgi:hypothetical protein
MRHDPYPSDEERSRKVFRGGSQEAVIIKGLAVSIKDPEFVIAYENRIQSTTLKLIRCINERRKRFN